MRRAAVWLLAGAVLAGCEKAPAGSPAEVMRQRIPGCRAVQLVAQVADRNTYLAEIAIDRDPHQGGGNEWNMVASRVFDAYKELDPSIVRSRFTFYSPQNNNLDWAHVSVDRKDLPADWKSQNYLQFFGHCEPMAGTSETTQWLCDFYREYAKVIDAVPEYCARYPKER